MRKLITYLLIAIFLAVALDYYARYQRRQKLGPGIALDPGGSIPVALANDFDFDTCEVGDVLLFRAVSSEPFSNEKAAEGIFRDATFRAAIVDTGYSPKIGRKLAVFKFDWLDFPNGQSYPFKGSILKSVGDSSFPQNSGSLGMHLGKDMGGGPITILSGYLVGTLLPYYSGRFLDAPLNYVTGDVKAGTGVILKGYVDYIPFDLEAPPPSTRTNAAKAQSMRVTLPRLSEKHFKRQPLH